MLQLQKKRKLYLVSTGLYDIPSDWYSEKFDGRLVLTDLLKVPIPHDIENYRLQPDDVIFNNTNSLHLIGEAAIVREPIPYTFSNHLTRIRVKKNKITPSWLLHILLRYRERNVFRSVCNTHVGQSGIGKEELRNLPIFFPTIVEQQQITSVLFRVNELVQTIEQIIEYSQRLKRGLIQKLFRNALLNNPIITIDEIKATTPNAISMGPFGSTIKTDNFVLEGVPVIRGINLTKEPFNMNGFVFLREEKADELRSANSFPGDIVFTHRGTLGQVGIIPEKTKYKRFIISQSQMKLTCNKNKAVPKFVYYFFKSQQGQKALLTNISRIGVPSIGQPTTTLKQIKIPLPRIADQQTISTTLTSIEKLIQLRIVYKEIVINLKTGLMQNLLTGKIRIRV